MTAEGQLTRREVLRAGGAAALMLGSGGLLGAAGADLARAAAVGAAARRGGTLRVGIAGGSPTDDFDMAHINGPSATVRGQVFYETLTYLDGQFRLHNDFLCDECEPNKTADTWTVRLKQGVEFHNGKTATADDVLFSIRRLMNPKSGATAAGQLTAIDLRRTRKLDNRTVRFVVEAAAVVLRLPPQRHRLHRPGRLRPEEAGQHGPLALQELPAGTPHGPRAVRELPRDTGVRGPADHLGASRRCRSRERAAVGAGRRDQPGAVPTGRSAQGVGRTSRSPSRPRVVGTRSRCGSTSLPSTTCG